MTGAFPADVPLPGRQLPFPTPHRVRCLLAARGALLFPRFASGRERAPFCSCTVPAAIAAGLLTIRSESGPETHIPIAIGPIVIQIEAKKARAAAIIVSAAAQRQIAAYPGRSLSAARAFPARFLEAADNFSDFHQTGSYRLIPLFRDRSDADSQPYHSQKDFCLHVHRVE